MAVRYDDSNYHLLLARKSATEDGAPECLPRRTVCGSPLATSAGLVPVLDYPDMLPDPKDFKEIIADCHAKKIFPMYHLQQAHVIDKWYQDGYGYCWAYGLSAAVMGARAAQGQPAVRLAPFSLGWLVNWRNAGYYCDEAIAGARQRGIASAEYVPEYNLNPHDFKAGWEQDALKYRPLEWWDTNRGEGVVRMIQQCLGTLMTGRPDYDAYNWWRHALMLVGMGWDESVSNNLVWLNWNSHDDGIIELTGDHGVPDEVYGVREVCPAPTS